MKLRTDIDRMELENIAGACVPTLGEYGVLTVDEGGVDEAEWRRLVDDVQHYLRVGAWSPPRPTAPITERVRLAIIAGVLEGAPSTKRPRVLTSIGFSAQQEPAPQPPQLDEEVPAAPVSPQRRSGRGSKKR